MLVYPTTWSHLTMMVFLIYTDSGRGLSVSPSRPPPSTNRGRRGTRFVVWTKIRHHPVSTLRGVLGTGSPSSPEGSERRRSPVRDGRDRILHGHFYWERILHGHFYWERIVESLFPAPIRPGLKGPRHYIFVGNLLTTRGQSELKRTPKLDWEGTKSCSSGE